MKVSSRRTFIKGLPVGLAGLALTSPFWDRLLGRAMAQEATQQRLLVWYVPDGTVTEWFWPSQTGALGIRADRTNDFSGKDFNTAIPEADRPTFLLQPIAAYADRTLLVKGLENPGEADHVLSTQSCLTGEAIRKGQLGTSPSLDVYMSEANTTSRHAEPVFRTGAYGVKTSYTGTRDLCRPRGSATWVEPSWQPISDARRLLDAVTGVPAGSTGPSPEQQLRSKSRLAALGSVRSRIEQLRCVAGTPAAQRFDAYVAEVQRLERLETEMRAATPFEPVLDAGDATVAAAQEDIARLPDVAPFLRELVVTALALDYSPTVTLQWGASGINKISGNKLTDYRYDFMPDLEYKGAGEHGLAHPEDGAFIDAGHNISAAVSTRDRVRIRRWYFEQMRLLLDRLKEVPDGAGSLFDSTTLLHVSEFGGPSANSRGGQHSNRNLPYMLVAGASTPFRTGQSLSVDRSHGDYLFTLAKAFGSTETSMGVGTSTIEGITR